MRLFQTRNRRSAHPNPFGRAHYRYGLTRPGRGQQWVRVDNDFLLISLGTGIIASIIAGR